MQHYVHNESIEHFKKLIAESERDPKRDEDRHAMLQTLLAKGIAKDKEPPAGETLGSDIVDRRRHLSS